VGRKDVRPLVDSVGFDAEHRQDRDDPRSRPATAALLAAAIGIAAVSGGTGWVAARHTDASTASSSAPPTTAPAPSTTEAAVPKSAALMDALAMLTRDGLAAQKPISFSDVGLSGILAKVRSVDVPPDVFFFHDGRFVATDVSLRPTETRPVATIRVSLDSIALVYASNRPDSGICCKTTQQVVVYRWTGSSIEVDPGAT
jgi:hypothetical protein